MRAETLWVLLVVLAASMSSANANPVQTCTLQSATPARFEDVLNDYKPFRDKCVRLHGFLASHALFDSVESFYRMTHEQRTPSTRLISLYGVKGFLQDWLWSYRGGVDIVGTISACELIDPTPGLIDWCHYQNGPLISVSELRPDPSEPRRLAGREARERFGDLTPVDGAAIPSARRKLIERWFDAIRRRDVQALTRQTSPALTSSSHEFEDLLNPVRSPYWSIIGRPRLPPIQYFVTTTDDHWTIGCVCRTADCKTEWPISADDAWPKEAWPYVCTIVLDSVQIVLP
jgi:hypothetical protein